MEANQAFLPDDIIVNILKRLPVKSLIRFQCVCKHWKKLFKTQSFIADHLHHSSLRNPSLLLQWHYFTFDFHLGLLDCNMQLVEVQNGPLIDSFSKVHMLTVHIFGSNNGLLCLELVDCNKCGHFILLWNPATRKVRQVPKAVNYCKDEDYCVGFGFSPIVNDYKIVRFFVSDFNYLVHQVEVYSLNTGSWKEVEFGNLDDVALISNFCSCFAANGAIFWFGSKLGVEEEDEEDIDLIVSFDIAMEVFTLIPIPISAVKPYRNNLTVYEDKLAMLSYTMSENFESSMIDLWVMEEATGAFGERWSWTKKYTSSPYPGRLLLPVTIWRNEIACDVGLLPGPITIDAENDEQKTILFNFTTNEFKMFDIRKLGGIFNYVESLVPVGNIHIE